MIVSQSHTAVDNVLEGLNIQEEISNKIIRIGKSEDVLEGIWKKYSISNSHDNWILSTTNASNSRLKELIDAYDINPDDLEKYISITAKLNSAYIPLKDELSFIEEFNIKYEPHLRIIRTAQIQHEWINRLRLAKDSEERLIENATIVAGTCTGFNSNPKIKNMNFDFVIVDEAAKASVPEILLPLLRGSRLILVGDQNQLPPFIKDDVVKICEDQDKQHYENGLFMRLYDIFPPSNRVQLSLQYRMHKTIGTMISKVFYNNTIDTGIEDSARTHSISEFEGKQIVWLSTSDRPFEQRKEMKTVGRSYRNYQEVRLIKNLLSNIDQEANQYVEIAISS